MSRFEELNRIKNAIKHNDQRELLWAREYCEMRFNLSNKKQHKNHWHKLTKEVNQTLNCIVEK